MWGQVVALLACRLACLLVAYVPDSGPSGPAVCWLWSSGLVPSFLSALLPCLCRVACKYAFISRFKGVFRGFWGADVYLYGLMSLRGLCGFCARV